MRAKFRRWQRNKQASARQLQETAIPLLGIAYFQTFFLKREKYAISVKPPFEPVLLYAVDPILKGTRAGWLTASPALLSPALGHVLALIGNILLFARIYLNPAHALEDGSSSTSHRRLPFHFLPEPWHCLPTPTPWASGLSCLHSGHPSTLTS